MLAAANRRERRPHMYDVAIVGSGPAGATLARMLGERYRVLLVDRRRLDLDAADTILSKPCGGLLAPAAQKELARQGLGVPHDVVAGPQLFAVRTVDLSADVERLYQRFYVNVDREAFDRWLASLVPAGVRRCHGWSLESLETDADAPTLHFSTAEGARASVRAKLVIGADGAGSDVRRLAYGDLPAPERYRAIQAAFDAGIGDPFYGAVFDESLTDFYGWTIPKGGMLLVGCAFPEGVGAPERFDEFVARLRRHGFRFGRESSRSSASLVRPSRAHHLLAGTGRVLLVGEAAGFISPSSAEGISYALRSAAHLAGALSRGIDGVDDRYAMAALPLALDVGVKAAKASAIYGAAVRRVVMRSGIGALPSGPSRLPTPTFGQFPI
jgi:geranylgeranyl diphosphate/geranylgeranyl-bacteriochlorophyllide a reductase